MDQIDLLEGQVQLSAASIGGRVARIHEALHHLAALSLALFEATPDDPALSAAWLADEGFGVDPRGGFFERAAHLERLRERTVGGRPPDHRADPMSFLWSPGRSEDPTARHHMYAQRGLGPELQALRGRFPEVVWIYYQDDVNVTLIAPALDGVTAIPPDFDWHGYHSFTAVDPAHDPARTVRWSPPNIDYGGAGLIVCASIPVWRGDRFLGVWSMDVPLGSVLRDALTTVAHGAEGSFLAAFDGHLVAHRSLTAVVATEGGSVYRERLAVLGGGFVDLDLAPLIAAGHGRLELRDANGAPLLVLFRTIPEIEWILFLALPRAQLTAARARTVQDALDRVREGDLSFRLDADGADDFDALAASYNAMAASLAAAVAAREAAEQALREQLELVESQRAEIDELSTPVIEVGEGVLAVPLVGALGSRRAGGLVERVLAEVTRLRARAVLLDLTGAESVDATSAQGLLQVARAVRLLGARCAFSGLTPALAQTLVEEAIDLQGVEAHATLKAALAAVAAGSRRRR